MTLEATIRPASLQEAVEVLAEAFTGYPVVRFVLGPDGHTPERTRTLVQMFVSNRVLRGDPVLALELNGEVPAVITMTRPDSPGTSAVIEAVAERAWKLLGEDARERYRAFAAAANSVDAAVPNLHVNMVGVRAAARGRGLARLLLEEAHRRSAADPASAGVSLTTENADNVPFYEHLGYRVVGHARIAEGFETWGFFRPDPQ